MTKLSVLKEIILNMQNILLSIPIHFNVNNRTIKYLSHDDIFFNKFTLKIQDVCGQPHFVAFEWFAISCYICAFISKICAVFYGNSMGFGLHSLLYEIEMPIFYPFFVIRHPLTCIQFNEFLFVPLEMSVNYMDYCVSSLFSCSYIQKLQIFNKKP